MNLGCGISSPPADEGQGQSGQGSCPKSHSDGQGLSVSPAVSDFHPSVLSARLVSSPHCLEPPGKQLMGGPPLQTYRLRAAEEPGEEARALGPAVRLCMSCARPLHAAHGCDSLTRRERAGLGRWAPV